MFIWLLCVWGSAVLFTGIGVYAIKRKAPMWFWSGSTVSSAEIADIPAYNRANGLMWIAYSLLYWFAGTLGLFSLAVGCVVLIASGFLGSAGLVIAYNRIYDRYSA